MNNHDCNHGVHLPRHRLPIAGDIAAFGLALIVLVFVVLEACK